MDDTCPSGGLLLDVSPDAVLVVERDGRIQFANRGASVLFARPADELVDTYYQELVPVDSREVHAKHHEDYFNFPTERAMGPAPCVRARRADGRVIDIDVMLTPIDGDRVAVFARRASATRRLVDRLAATNRLLTAALEGAGDGELQQRSLSLIREVVGSDTACMTHLDGRPPREWVGHADDGGDGARLAEWLSQRESSFERAELTSTSDGSPAIVVPVKRRSGTRLIALGRATSEEPFDELDAQVATELTAAIALAFDLVETRLEHERSRFVAEHDRIARDLHDIAIQRIFAVAMRLESTIPEATGIEAERMSEAVDGLDQVIREIRGVIFDLRRPTVAITGLRAAVAAEIDEVAGHLGFAPRVQFSGVLDAAVSAELTEIVRSVVRELLSNCARHAGASSISVEVHHSDQVLHVVVTDDGAGLPDDVGPGDGLTNLAERAASLGGTFHIDRRTNGGTMAHWTAPVDATVDRSGTPSGTGRQDVGDERISEERGR